MVDSTQSWRERIEVKLEKVYVLLTGDGNPHKGIVVRLDRLEQRARRMAMIQTTVITTIVAVVVSGFMTWMLTR